MRFCKYVNGKGVTRERIEPIRNKSGHRCEELQEMWKVLDDYFSSVLAKDMKAVERDIEAKKFETGKKCLDSPYYNGGGAGCPMVYESRLVYLHTH